MRALLAAALLLALPASGQSLAEAAQKEKERRAKAKEKGAAAVVTEDALKANKGALANDPKAATAALPTTSPPRPRAAPEPDRRVLEEDWRRRMTLAREQVARWQEYHDAWSQQHLAPNEYFVDENGRKLVGNAENLRKLIAHAKANLDAAKQALEDLEQQARRENVPPGWLR
jgi:hypothetical protein